MDEILPLVCSFEDGCILTLVPVPTDLTMDQVAAAMAPHFVGRMLAPRDGVPLRVRAQGDADYLPRDLLVRDTGWPSMTTIQVGYETPVAPQKRKAIR
ncbi:MAG: toluene-4-monooxygenase system B family protein [Sporichthyaceae bacterium]